MAEHTGWLLDIYADDGKGVTLWLLCDDGERRQFHQVFPVTFYVSGESSRLRLLWKWIELQSLDVILARMQRQDLFAGPTTVLAVQVEEASAQPAFFKQISRKFPDLTYYDADIDVPLRYSAVYGVFPLARCRVHADEGGEIRLIAPLDSPWEPHPPVPPLRILAVEPDVNPAYASPAKLNLRFGRDTRALPLEPARPFLLSVANILKRYDPDLILTRYGDTWTLPYLLNLADELEIPFNLNRDPRRVVLIKKAHSYWAYGQTVYRGQQVHLFGRWHIDRHNAMLYGEYGLQGVLEQSRVTSLPVQVMARNSPGSGITAMQIITALRRKTLVPYQKQQAEDLRSARDLIRADHGGLVYQPILGLHRDVGMVDFTSMYPAVMVRFNISPETVGANGGVPVPELNLTVDNSKLGLVPETLQPLLQRRIDIKEQLSDLDRNDCRYPLFKARSEALKWLLVVCFGYLGYKNARFGKIESHQAVTAYGREALLRAKEAAEALGFEVLHLYTDALWIKKPGVRQPADFKPVLEKILDATGLPIALEGVFRWVAFLPSRMNARVPVANRYFGVFQDGRLKYRGIEIRRHDTPPFIQDTQLAVLKRLAGVPRVEDLAGALPQIVAGLRERLVELRAGKIPIEELLITQRLSRELSSYKVPSAVARAGAQLQAAGKDVRPGMVLRFAYTRDESGVRAWGLPQPFPHASVSYSRYIELFIRAMHTVLQPFGVEEYVLRDWLLSNAGYFSPPGFVQPRQDMFSVRPQLKG
jgi:DNA polymerase-2